MRRLICRFGGIGDSVILTVVAKEMVKRGDEVTYAVMEPHVPIFSNLTDLFVDVLPTRRIFGIDCVPYKHGWVSLDRIKDDFGVGVVDYKFSIERNSNYHHLQGIYGEWITHQNSNYANWIDVSLGWANIDPMEVTDRKPVYRTLQSETNWAKGQLSDIKRPIIAMQLNASSLARTWYHAAQVPRAIVDKWPHVSCLLFDGSKWLVLRKDGKKEIELPENQVRHSAALLKESDLFIASDTGLVQIADAIDVPTIACYTTVPAWTRTRDSKNIFPLESEPLPCRPCFTLDRVCPQRKKESVNFLTDREREMKGYQESNTPIDNASSLLKTRPELLNEEFKAMQSRIESLSGLIPYCMDSITTDRITEKVGQVLCL